MKLSQADQIGTKYPKYVEAISGKPFVFVFEDEGKKFCLDQENVVMEITTFPGYEVELVVGDDGKTHVITPRLPHYRAWRAAHLIAASIRAVDVANHGGNKDPSIPYTIAAQQLYMQIPKEEQDLLGMI
jgi:hypothetical protein